MTVTAKNISLVLCAFAVGALATWFVARQKEAEHQRVDATPDATKHGVITAAPNEPTKAGPRPLTNPRPATPSPEEQKLMETLRDNVVVNLGKIEDIGRQSSAMMTSRKELRELRKIPAADRTPEQSARLLELERQSANALGMLGEIASFQNNPDEYSRFFGSLLQEAGHLDPNQTAAVSNYMHDRGAAMVANGFNAANEPANAAEAAAWETKRDAFNKETADGVAALLPPGLAKSIGFTPGFLEVLEQDFQDEEH